MDFLDFFIERFIDLFDFIDFMDFLDFFIERFIDLFAILLEGCVLQVSETNALFLFRFHVSHSVQVQYLLCDHDSPLEETPPCKDGSNPPLPRSASERSFISPPRLHGSISYFFFFFIDFIDFMDFLDFFIERFIDLFAILLEGCVLQVSETNALFLFRSLSTYHIVYRFNIFSAIMIHLSRRRRHGRMDQTHHSHALPPKGRSFRLLGSMGPSLISSSSSISSISWTFLISSSSASSIFSPYCLKAVFFRFRKQTLCFFFAFTYHIVYRFNIFSAIMIHLSRRRRHGRMDQTH